jgi:hypothetical protein
MKAIAFFFIVVFPFCCPGQYCPTITDKLSSEVHGDTVILKDDSAYRNCGAHYSMEFSYVSGNTYRWIQRDIGSYAYCYCNFNLSVTIDSLESGYYVVNTYYTTVGSTQLNFIGTITFTISKPASNLTPAIIGEEQSDCYVVGIFSKKKDSDVKLNVYPNPVTRYLKISIDLEGEKIIAIKDLRNKCVFQQTTEKNDIILDLVDLTPQMYFINIKSRDMTICSKFIKNR